MFKEWDYSPSNHAEECECIPSTDNKIGLTSSISDYILAKIPLIAALTVVMYIIFSGLLISWFSRLAEILLGYFLMT